MLVVGVCDVVCCCVFGELCGILFVLVGMVRWMCGCGDVFWVLMGL